MIEQMEEELVNVESGRTDPAKKMKMELAWTHTEKKNDSIAKQALQWTVEHHKATELASDQRTSVKQVWRK